MGEVGEPPPGLRSVVRGRLLVALVVFAALVRLLFLAADPDGDLLSGLSAPQGEAARNIVDNGEWFRIDPDAINAIREVQMQDDDLVDPEDFDYSSYGDRTIPELISPQGPVLLLAGLWELTGSQRYIWLQLLQLVVGAALTLVVVWLSWRLFARRGAAIVAGLLWALWPGLAYFTTLPLYEIWAVYAALGVTALYVLTRDRGSPWWMLVLLGLAVAVSTLFRQGLIFLPLAFAAYELRDSWRVAARTLAIVSVATVVGLIPWTVRSLIEFDQPRPFNGVSGQVLWEALGQDSDAFGAVYDDDITLDQVHEARPELEYGTAAYDDYLRDKAVTAIGDHPLDYAQIVVGRVAKSTIGNNFEIGIESDEEGAAGFAISWVNWVHGKLDGLLFLVALVSAVVMWRRPADRRSVELLALVYLAVLLTPAFISGHLWRYMAPALPVLFILAGVGLDEAWTRLRSRRGRPSGTTGTEPEAQAGLGTPA